MIQCIQGGFAVVFLRQILDISRGVWYNMGRLGDGLTMLKRFEVKNFKGFKDKLVFDLSATREYAFNTEFICNNIVNKALILHGILQIRGRSTPSTLI